MYYILVFCIFNTKISISFNICGCLYYIYYNSDDSLFCFVILLNNMLLFYNLKFSLSPIIYCFVIPSNYFHISFFSVFFRITKKFYDAFLLFTLLSEVFFYFSHFHGIVYSKFYLCFPFKVSKFYLIFYTCLGTFVYSKINIFIPTKVIDNLHFMKNFVYISKYVHDSNNVIFLNKKNLTSKFLYFLLLKKLYFLLS